MVRNAIVLCFALIGSQAIAQITDARAIMEANRYVSVLAPEALKKQPRVWRDAFEVRGRNTEYIEVLYGDATVSLERNGTFIGFSVSGPALLPLSG